MSKSNKITVWITKQALTSGILCVEAEQVNERMVNGFVRTSVANVVRPYPLVRNE